MTKEQIEKKIAELREMQKEIEKKEKAKEREKAKKQKAKNDVKIAKLVREFHDLRGMKSDEEIIKFYEDSIAKLINKK